MHAFATRHKVIVIALLLISVVAYLGLYATRRSADAAPPETAGPSGPQSLDTRTLVRPTEA